MCDLSHKIHIKLQPIFVSRNFLYKQKIGTIEPREIKPPIVNQQCVVYSFTCDLYDSDYVNYAA